MLEVSVLDADGRGGRVDLLELGCGSGTDPAFADVGGVVSSAPLRGERGAISGDAPPGLYLVSAHLSWTAPGGVAGSVSAVAAVRIAAGVTPAVVGAADVGC